MKLSVLLLALSSLLASPLSAQTTVVNFDSPACATGSLPASFGGITWSQSPSGWSCEGSWNADSTRHIFFTSSTQKQASLTFASPQVFVSVQVFADTIGTLTITDDGGQTVTFSVAKTGTIYTVTTNWTKASNTVTFNYSSGWAAGFDNFTFAAPAPPPPPPPPPPPTITGVTVSCSSLAVIFGETSNCSATVTGTGAFDNGVNWTVSDGLISAGGIFTAPSTVESVGVTATSIQDPTVIGIATIVVSRPPIDLNVTLVWDDRTPIAGTVQIQQMIGTANTMIATFTLDATGTLKGPVSIDLTQPDPLIIRFVLTDPAGKNLGVVQETIPKAMFASITKAVASLTVAKASLTLKGISWASQ